MNSSALASRDHNNVNKANGACTKIIRFGCIVYYGTGRWDEKLYRNFGECHPSHSIQLFYSVTGKCMEIIDFKFRRTVRGSVVDLLHTTRAGRRTPASIHHAYIEDKWLDWGTAVAQLRVDGLRANRSPIVVLARLGVGQPKTVSRAVRRHPQYVIGFEITNIIILILSSLVKSSPADSTVSFEN